ncbi:MAG: ABC transporter ATP-binding protein [Actinomycetota bacterium]
MIGRTIVEARDLTKSYRRGPEEVRALQHASFELRAGEVVALLGPSGSGKTTLLNLLCGWEHPDGGEIRWRASGTGDQARLPWRELAVVPQGLGLLEELTVAENARLPFKLAGGDVGPDLVARSGALLADLGLAELRDRYPHELSLGEQQRTALARAVVAAPRLLLADEPTGHQDTAWGRGVMNVIAQTASEGAACLVATHNVEVLKQVDRVLEMRDGRLLADAGSPPSLIV